MPDPVTGVIGGSAVLGAYSSNKAASKQASASRAAGQQQVRAAQISADAQREANEKNIEFQREIFEQQREDSAPWREIGTEALSQLQQGVERGEFDPGSFSFNFQKSPGYDFRKQEGIDAMDASAASRGRLQSGAQQRALTRYGQNVASQEYGNAFNRQAQTYQMNAGRQGDNFNRLASLAQVGQTANNRTQAARSNMASQVGQSTRATGNAIAQGAMRSGNAMAQSTRQAGQARASAYQGMAQSANQGMQNYLLYNMMGS